MQYLLLVDDEPVVLAGIREILAKENLPIKIVCCENGAEALQEAMLHRPDILLTDVRMPIMDGIELAEAVRNAYPSCSIVFMSNYSDTEYLKSAIRLRAVDYIEKPISANASFLPLVRKLIELSASVSEEEKQTDSLRIQELVKMRLCQMLTEKKPDLHEAELYLHKMESPFTCTSDVRCVIFSDSSAEELRKFAELKLRSRNDVVFYIRSQSMIVSFFFANNTQLLCDDIITVMFNKMAGEYTNLRISTGRLYKHLENAHLSYVEATEISEYFFFSEELKTVLYKKQDMPETAVLNDSLIQEFGQLLSTFNVKKCTGFLTEIYQYIGSKPDTSILEVKTFYFRLMEKIIQFSRANRLKFRDFDSREAMRKQIFEQNKLLELHRSIVDWVYELFDLSNTVFSDEHMIRLVLIYIHNNLDKPELDIQDICDFSGYSSSYLMHQFKLSVGMTINKYISKERIAEACRLLVETNDTLETIVEKVGISSTQYFCRLFKKQMLLSPGEYREMKRNGS